MFERYTEKARRTIFFARYEASVFGSPYIETEHLVLGVLREDRSLRNRLPSGAAEQIRKRIEERVPQPVERIASVDLPLSKESKKALHYAAEESEALRHAVIDCGHLLLGLCASKPRRPRSCCGNSGSSTPAIAKWWGRLLPLLRCPQSPPPDR
jgi:ATP-dependent Clp protease ATP-binding subunit ClpC